MKRYNHSNSYPDPAGRKNPRTRRRRRSRVRLWAVSAPILAIILISGRGFWSPSVEPDGRVPAADTSLSPSVYPVIADSSKIDYSGEPVPVDSGALGEDDTPPQRAQENMDDWNLLLVNPWNYLPEGYDITLTQLVNGLSVDERCYPALQELMDDCRAAGLSPVICSAYRSMAKQEQLFGNKVNSLMARGYSEREAKVEAGKSIAVPGTSEHNLGLALDIVDINNQNLDSSQEKTDVQQWLMENSWRYGFILRYPSDKSELTGIMYEPWHYRYVGEDAAQYIYENSICLEEYLDQLSKNT